MVGCRQISKLTQTRCYYYNSSPGRRPPPTRPYPSRFRSFFSFCCCSFTLPPRPFPPSLPGTQKKIDIRFRPCLISLPQIYWAKGTQGSLCYIGSDLPDAYQSTHARAYTHHTHTHTYVAGRSKGLGTTRRIFLGTTIPGALLFRISGTDKWPRLCPGSGRRQCYAPDLGRGLSSATILAELLAFVGLFGVRIGVAVGLGFVLLRPRRGVGVWRDYEGQALVVPASNNIRDITINIARVSTTTAHRQTTTVLFGKSPRRGERRAEAEADTGKGTATSSEEPCFHKLKLGLKEQP